MTVWYSLVSTIRFRNCYDSYLVFSCFYYYISELLWQFGILLFLLLDFSLELLWQCGILLFLLLDFGTVMTVWYSLVSTILLLYFGTVMTVWYSLVSTISLVFRNCYDSVVFSCFYYYISELLWQCGILLFLLLDFGTVMTVWYSLVSTIRFRNCYDSLVFSCFYY